MNDRIRMTHSFGQALIASAGLSALALTGCALQPPAATALPPTAAAWSSGAVDVTAAPAVGPSEAWWSALGDEGIATLVDAALANSPTLAQAMARIDEARASAQAAGASSLPSLSAELAGSRGNNKSFDASADWRASGTLSLSWELDLFGRLRHGRAAASMRLDARTADAESTRLSLQAQVADTALSLQACALVGAAQAADVRSRELTLELTQKKRQVGMVAPADVARVESGLADARGALATTRGQCAQYQQALIALSGLSSADVSAVLTRSGPLEQTTLPHPPPTQLALPANVVAKHPGVVAVLRSADAAYEEIGSARAGRLPSLNLASLLSSQWVWAGGDVSHSGVWSLAPAFTGAVFDNGAGSASVDGARARYAQAIANLNQTLRTTVQDVETALAQLAAAQERVTFAEQGVRAARALFAANDASWRAGRLSLFELEDARRTLTSSRTAEINARRDQAQAWVSLVKATGNGIQISPRTAAL
jgi:outer membrane protein, multidrug efflux system